MGEIMHSYVGYVQGPMLLGGVVGEHKSSRFESMDDATAWVAAVLKGNWEADRVVTAHGVAVSEQAPEIPTQGE